MKSLCCDSEQVILAPSVFSVSLGSIGFISGISGIKTNGVSVASWSPTWWALESGIV